MDHTMQTAMECVIRQPHNNHDTEMFSALVGLCAGNQQWPVDSQSKGLVIMVMLCFWDSLLLAYHTVQHTVKLPVIWDTMTSLKCENIIDQSHKSHIASVSYPTMHHSEQKCGHFCSEWCIVGYENDALWDLWIRSIVHEQQNLYSDCSCSWQPPYHTTVFGIVWKQRLHALE